MLSRDLGCLNQASCHPPIYRPQAAVRCVADLVFLLIVFASRIDRFWPPTHPPSPLFSVYRGLFPRGPRPEADWPSMTAPRLRTHEAASPPTYAHMIRCAIKHNKTSSPLGVPRLKCVGTASCRRLVQSFRNPLVICRGNAVAQWLRCCATNLKVAGSIPAGVIGIFHWNKILPITLWPWGRLSL